jgi:hypothetical protein
MGKKNIHVVPNSNGWGVKAAGNTKPAKVFETQKQAIEYGRQRAISGTSELFIHGKNGQIRERNSYGNDPHPPKG